MSGYKSYLPHAYIAQSLFFAMPRMGQRRRPLRALHFLASVGPVRDEEKVTEFTCMRDAELDTMHCVA
jgi:hypothetical protein